MNIRPNHHKLNIFNHFGDSAQNENNTTRAFLVAATRSSGNASLMRSFVELVLGRAKDGGSPKAGEHFELDVGQVVEVDVSMEVNIRSDSFPGPGVRRAILVELTPETEKPEHPSTTGEFGGEKFGRVDATIVATCSGGTPVGIVVESKLYGPVGHDQFMKYKTALESRGIEVAEVQVTWEEIYRLVASLPVATQQDPILEDFKSFLELCPWLVGFTGFKQTDFQDDFWGLDLRLMRFAAALMAENRHPLFQNEPPERKRGGLDYDIRLRDQWKFAGNIGVACWERRDLYAKLVIGSRSRWETDTVIKHGQNRGDVHSLLRKIASRAAVSIDVAVRPFFSRFRYAEAARLSLVTEPKEDPASAWSKAMEFAHRYQGEILDSDRYESLIRIPAPVLKQDLLRSALKEQKRCFVQIVLAATWTPEELGQMTPESQMDTVSKALNEMAELLALVSAKAPKSETAN